MSEEGSIANDLFAGSNIEIDATGDDIIDTREALGRDVRLCVSQGRALQSETGGVPRTKRH